MTTRAQQVAVFAPRPECLGRERFHFSETDWNWHMRRALQKQGNRSFHIREASEVGVADLIVYRKLTHLPRLMQCDLQVIEAWLELKVLDPGRDLLAVINPGQKEFLRDHWRIARNALVVTYDRKIDMLTVKQGDLKGRTKMLSPDVYAIDWQEVFAHFKARKVSL